MAHFRLVNPAVKDSVNIDMNILDPKEGQAEQEVEQTPAPTAGEALESASLDQAMEAAEEGGTEG